MIFPLLADEAIIYDITEIHMVTLIKINPHPQMLTLNATLIRDKN